MGSNQPTDAKASPLAEPGAVDVEIEVGGYEPPAGQPDHEPHGDDDPFLESAEPPPSRPPIEFGRILASRGLWRVLLAVGCVAVLCALFVPRLSRAPDDTNQTDSGGSTWGPTIVVRTMFAAACQRDPATAMACQTERAKSETLRQFAWVSYLQACGNEESFASLNEAVADFGIVAEGSSSGQYLERISSKGHIAAFVEQCVAVEDKTGLYLALWYRLDERIPVDDAQQRDNGQVPEAVYEEQIYGDSAVVTVTYPLLGTETVLRYDCKRVNGIWLVDVWAWEE